MAILLVVTEDDAFAVAAQALSSSELTVTRAHVEEAVALMRQVRPQIVAVDADSIRDAKSLIGSLSLLTRSRVVALAHQPRRGTEAAATSRMAGAGARLPKPSG